MTREHDLITRYFVPLSERYPGGLGLSDDAAIMDIPEGMQLVVTNDAISEGVHYLADTDPGHIAQKLLRTNLSDLASMGAEPLCYFLALALPSPINEDFIARFAAGLAEDQETFGITLAGGDTISTQGAPVFSITAHGLVPHGQALRRSGAKAGDALYVSGTLGDAALGLASLRGAEGDVAIDLPPYSTKDGSPRYARDDKEYLVERYHLPQPRLELGITLRGLAASAIDISDGLLQDAGHLCTASQVGMEIHRELLPLSEAAIAMLAGAPDLWPLIYSGGDDYELLFTLPEGVSPPAGVTRIGSVTAGSKTRLFSQGAEILVEKTGYSH